MSITKKCNPKTPANLPNKVQLIKQLYPYHGLGGNKKLPPCRFPKVGIVWSVPLTTNTTQQQHHHNGELYAPLTVWDIDRPNPMQGTSSKGVGQGHFGLVLYETVK
jgi:hypothetical protein